MAQTTSKESPELLAAKALVASIEKRDALALSAKEFAEKNGFKSIGDLVASLTPAPTQKRGRPAGSKVKKVKGKKGEKMDGRSKLTPELLAEIKAFMATDPKPSKNKTAKHFKIQPVTLNNWLGIKPKKRAKKK